MTGAIAGWLMGLAGAAAVCAIALAVCPTGRVRGVLRLVCGCVMAVALISPLVEFDFDAYARAAARYGDTARQAAQSGVDTETELRRTIIQDECAAYILDKAEGLGLSGSVAVTAAWSSEGCWYPFEARLSLSGGEDGKQALSDIVTTQLGVPPERQYWGE